MSELDFRVEQVRRLWNLGYGEAIGKRTFESYHDSIPEVPAALEDSDEYFPDTVLVDARQSSKRVSAKNSIWTICQLLGIQYTQQLFFAGFDECHQGSEPVYWMRCQDGSRASHSGKYVSEVEGRFASDETAMSIHEVLAMFAQNPVAFRGRVVAALRSRELFLAGGAALCWLPDQCSEPFISRYLPDDKHAFMGVATRRRR